MVGIGSAGLLAATACSGDSFTPGPPSGTAGSGGAGAAGGTGGGAGNPGKGGGAGSSAGGAGGSEMGGSAGAGGVGPQGGSAGETAAGAAGADAGGNAGTGAGATSGGSAGAASGGSAGSVSGGSAGSVSGGSAGAASGSAGSAGAASGGSAGATAAGNGGTTSGGSAGSAGSGGGAPIPCTLATSDCGDGNYCPQDTKICTPCTDLSRVVIGKAEDVFPASKGGLFYPRVALIGGQFLLSYREGADSPNGEIAAVRASVEAFVAANASVLPAPISEPAAHDSALFVLPDGVRGVAFGAKDAAMNEPGAVYALFDSNRSISGDGLKTGRKSLFVARLPTVASPTSAVVERLEGDFTTANGEEGDDFSPAYAKSTKRLYWMRSRGTGINVSHVIVSKQIGTPEAPKAFTVPAETCPPGTVLTPGNYAPWVTPDGGHLFYSQLCAGIGPAGIARSVLVHVALDASGTVSKGPFEVIDADGGVAAPGSTHHRSPSLSPDQCRLYWEKGGRLFSAARE